MSTNGNGQLATRTVNLSGPVGQAGTMKSLLATMKTQIAEALPKHVTAERMMKAAMVAVNQQPKLLECTQSSVMQAIMQAAGLGLDPSGGVLGQGYLVPYGKTCQFIPGYRGLIDLVRRGGDVRSISAAVVYKGDEFDYGLGTRQFITHKPGEHDENDADITHVYAVAKLGKFDCQFEVMTRRQIEKIMHGSQSKGAWGPWRDHFAEMAKKTAIRRLVKLLPISSERLAKAIEMSDASDSGRPAVESIIEPPAPAPLPSTNAGDALAGRLIERGDDTGNDTPADEVIDVPTDTGPLPAFDVSTWTKFAEAINTLAAENNVDKADAESALLKLMGDQKIASQRSNVGPPARTNIIGAIQHGMFDWKTATVTATD